MSEVRIWASQLAANDFPPVCAMTGRPAETWRKFSFRTPPPWVYALLVFVVVGLIGIDVFAIVEAAVSEKASGHLPLTKSSRNRLRIVIWTVVGLLPATFILLILGAVFGAGTDASTSVLGGILSWLGVLAFLLFVIGAVTRSFWGPRAKVYPPQPGYMDKLVELRNVHPSFVAAVQQQHAARVAQAQPQA